MFVVIIRTVILYILVFLVMRLMGKRQIGQLQPNELAVAIIVSSLAAVPMEDISIPMINSIVPILLLLSMEVIVSLISLKSNRARSILCGKPSVLVENGKIVESEIKRVRMNINDLLEQLRIEGYPNIADVEFAVLETNGRLSVIPRSQKRPVTPEDLGIATGYEGLSHSLIIDGQVDGKKLSKIGLSMEWLKGELTRSGITNTADVLYASLDTQGRLYWQKKER